MLSINCDHPARLFYYMGFSVIPVKAKSKVALYPWQAFQETRPKPNQLNRWLRLPLNFGLVTGKCLIEGNYPGLVVIDFDNMEDYQLWTQWVEENNPGLGHGYKVKTNRGVHVYLHSYKANEIRNLHYGGVDIKAAGGYVMMEGSIHPSGHVYKAMEQDNYYFPLFDTLDQALPEEILSRKTEISYASTLIPSSYTEPSIEDVLNAPVNTLGGNAIDWIRQNRRIEELIKPVKWTGPNWYVAYCPFHDDENPSMWVKYDTAKGAQYCGCYAGCNGSKPWDIVNLFSRLYQCNNNEAIIRLRNYK